MKKYVPLFEEYVQINENQLIDDIFEQVLINISEDEIGDEMLPEDETQDETERELSRGERAAVTRGDDLTEEWQLAYAYLYMNNNLGAFNNPDFADSLDYLYPLKASTFTRILRKFRDIEAGIEQGEGDERNMLYPKIITAYNKFKDMNINDVVALAASGINTETNVASKEYQEKGHEQRIKAKQKEGQIAAMLNGLIQSLSAANIPNAAWKAVSKLSKDLGMDVDKLRKIYKTAYNIDINKQAMM